jgi:hypothetical protein
MMAGIEIRFSHFGQLLLYVVFGKYRIGQGNKFTAFFFVNSFGGLRQGEVRIVYGGLQSG